ncbi:MAG: tail fiber domain-containing protein [Shinella sp.]|nr:tail fiber domain-containing protein [Shinella sp.]
MGKSAPKPPDPKDTSAASTATNVGTAVANAFLGNVNQVTPDGSLSYNQSGSYKWYDPYTKSTYDIPTFTATQTLSPAQQAIKDQNDLASKNLSQLAATQSGKLNNLLGSPMDMSGLPAAGDPTKVGLPQYQQFGSGPQLQTGLGNYGNVQSSIAGAGDIQKTVADSGNIQTSLGNAGDITRSYETDFSADRQRVEDALMARLNPQLEQDRAALETRLVNQGLQPGSEAYNRAIDEANRSGTDARLSAILSAGQEQSRLAGLANQAATFQNSAQQQAYNQMLGSGQFANSAQAQQYAQNANNMQMGNAAQQQQFSQNQAQQQANNSAQQQKFEQGLAGAQLNNTAQQQMYQNQTSATGANNSLKDQSFNAQMAMINAQNQQRQQALQEAYAQRNQPINEIIGLMGGTQVQNPNFVNTNMPTIPTTDVAGLINTNYGQQMQAWQQNQANAGGLLGGLGSLFGSFNLSDDDAKKNKTRHGDIKGKMGLWSYNYKNEPAGTPKRFGLMASEVEKAKPSAVARRNGLRFVNYEKALA